MDPDDLMAVARIILAMHRTAMDEGAIRLDEMLELPVDEQLDMVVMLDEMIGLVTDKESVLANADLRRMRHFLAKQARNGAKRAKEDADSPF